MPKYVYLFKEGNAGMKNLLGGKGVCVVPLSGFYCKRDGFRTTLLECDDEKRRWTYQTIADAIREYLR